MSDINNLKDICISSGTLRAEDLLPRFMGILKDYAPEKFNEFIKGYPELDGWEEFLEADWRIISDDTKMNASDDLFGLLNDIAPEGTMFSSTEGDGADFGFWSVEEKRGESKDITTLTDLKKFILSKNDNSVVFGVNSTGDLYFVDSVNGKEVPASADSLAVAEDDSDEHGKRIGNQGTGYFVVWKNGKRPTYMTALQIYDELLKIARSCAIKEKLLYDDEGEKALKQMAKDGKSTGEVAADIRYDVATALDMAVEKAEDLMTKFGLDNIYVLRAKGLSPKAIAKKILKACESKTEAALRPWRTDFEKALQKRIDDAKGTKYDTKDFTADGWEFVTGDVYDDGSEYGSDGKDVAVAFFKREQDGQYYRMWLAFDPDTKEITDGKWWIESDESKDERRDSADYLQEVWDALVPVWDKEKFDMAKGYDDEYECEAITITSKDNEGVRAKIYVDDHEGKHPVGFNVIYRYPGDKGVGDLGYYEFQSTDFDETAPEIFAYFDELKGKVGEAKDKFVVGMMISLDGVKQYIREIKPRTFVGQSVDTGKEFTLPLASLNRASVLFDPRTSEKQSEAKKSEDFKDFTLNQLRYFVKQGWSKDLTNASDEEIQEIIDSGHEISGVSNGTYGMNGLKITYRNPDGTVGSGVVIGRVPNLFALLTPLPPKKDESCKREAKKYYGYGKDDAIDKEDNDFMWQVAYDWFVDKLPEKLARHADKAVTDVIDKDSRAYEEIVTMDDYYDYLETYGPAVIEEITGDLAESKKTESSGADLASIYGDGDVSTHENSADGFYVDEHDPMGFAVLNNDTATMKKLFSGKAVAPEKPWTYAGWHEDIDAPENKDGSYPYVYDWEREYDLNFVNDWKRVVGDKDNEEALELLLQYAPDFIPSAMDFWNAFHAGYSKGLLRKLFNNIFAVVDKDDPYNNYLGYGDYTYDEVAKFLDGKGESKNEDLNTAKDFVYSIAPIGILVRQAGQPGFNGAKNSDDHIIVGFMHHDNTRFIIDWDADKKQGTVTRQVMVDDKESQYGYKWVTPKSNANVTFTTREELKDFVEGSWDNTSSESKNESLTLKQKELKDMARYGEAEDITTISDAEAKELKKKGIETVGVSRGTYGMNGALLRDRDGNKYVITARSSNLFYFV